MFPKDNLKRVTMVMAAGIAALLLFAVLVQHRTLADFRPHFPSMANALTAERIGVTTVARISAPTMLANVERAVPPVDAQETLSVEPAASQLAGRMAVLSLLAPKRNAKLLLRRTAGSRSAAAGVPVGSGAWVAYLRFDAPDIYTEVGEYRALVVMLASDSAFDALVTDTALATRVRDHHASQLEHFLYMACLADWQKQNPHSQELPMVCIDTPYKVMHPAKARALERLLKDARSCADAIVAENLDDIRGIAAVIGSRYPAHPDTDERKAARVDIMGPLELHQMIHPLRMPKVQKTRGTSYQCMPAR